MINKTNNVSFKGIYIAPSVLYVKPKNREKINFTVNLLQNYSNNDIFIGGKPNGEAVFEIMHRNDDLFLADPTIAEETNMRPRDYAAMYNWGQMLKDSYKKVMGIADKSLSYETLGIDMLSEEDIALKVLDKVCKFNKKYPFPKERLN